MRRIARRRAFPRRRRPPRRKRSKPSSTALALMPVTSRSARRRRGGDLLFHEACQKRGVRCRVLLPFDEAQFIDKSVASSAGGDKWRDRFYAMKQKLADPIRIMPDELGLAPMNTDPFERCNLWLLYSALAGGIDKLRFVTLWDGRGGDGPGGTAHMYDEVKKRTGRVTWLDMRTL